VDAAVDVVQIRERDLDAADLLSLVRDAVDIAQSSSTRIVVNDRLDVALSSGAAGVHLRGDGIPPKIVRSHVPRGFLVGRSVHSRDEAVLHGAHVDYLIAGTVWDTASKPGATALLGRAGLAEIVRAVEVPVLAIGGVEAHRFRDIAESGAAGAAAVGLFIAGPARMGCGAMPLTNIVKEARTQFRGER
jgi:thiamine-phosphate pyrophosphorylase